MGKGPQPWCSTLAPRPRLLHGGKRHDATASGALDGFLAGRHAPVELAVVVGRLGERRRVPRCGAAAWIAG